MKIIAQWSDADIQKVRDLLLSFGNSSYQQEVRSRNLRQPWIRPSDDEIWDTHIQCMLTSQQRSGPDGPVARVFGDLAPGSSEVSIARLQRVPEPVLHAQEFLQAKGFRKWRDRGKWIAGNFRKFITDGRCLMLERTSANLIQVRSQSINRDVDLLALERTAVSVIIWKGEWKVAGLGPKQARHFLKGVGLAAYTLPLDSRLMRFLWEVVEAPDEALPWTDALVDEYTFRMVENWFSDLARKVGITPVELDTLLWEASEKKRIR